MALRIHGMPLLESYAHVVGPRHFAGTNVVYVNHLISDSLMVARALRHCGARLWCACIPYGDLWGQAQVDVLEGFRDLGWVDAPFVDRPTRFNERMRAVVDGALAAAVSDAERSGRDLLIIEDGGYAFPRVDCHPRRRAIQDRLIGAVEHTTRGMLNYRFCEVDGEPFTPRTVRHPAITIADSRLKAEHEARFVAEALVDELCYLLRRRHEFVHDRAVLLLGGAGRLGKGLARALAAKTDRLAIADPAIGSAPNADRRHHVEVTPALLDTSFLVFGATGRSSVPLPAFLAWLDGALAGTPGRRIYFASASSKSLEFTNLIEWLDAHLEDGDEAPSPFRVARTRIWDHGIAYTVHAGEPGRAVEITFLADGYPVIFFPSGSHGAPNLAMDPVMTQLFLSAALLRAAHEQLPPAVHSVEDLHSLSLPPGPWADLLEPRQMMGRWRTLAGVPVDRADLAAPAVP